VPNSFTHDPEPPRFYSTHVPERGSLHVERGRRLAAEDDRQPTASAPSVEFVRSINGIARRGARADS